MTLPPRSCHCLKVPQNFDVKPCRIEAICSRIGLTPEYRRLLMTLVGRPEFSCWSQGRRQGGRLPDLKGLDDAVGDCLTDFGLGCHFVVSLKVGDDYLAGVKTALTGVPLVRSEIETATRCRRNETATDDVLATIMPTTKRNGNVEQRKR